jgi:hypothetical protein
MLKEWFNDKDTYFISFLDPENIWFDDIIVHLS